MSIRDLAARTYAIMEKEKTSTADLLQRVVIENTKDVLTLGELKDSFHERGFGLLMAIAAIPLSFPIPAPPGFATIFSIPLFIISVQMVWGLDSPWLPNWLAKKEIERKTLATLFEKANPYLRRIEALLKPRFAFASSKNGEKMIGISAFIFCIPIALPVPLSNFLPGLGILLMSLGLLSRDGLLIIIGSISGWVGTILTTFIIIFGIEIISEIPSFLKLW